MKIQHQLRLAAARCLALLQRYHDGERTVAAREKMVAEVEVVIGWLLELGLPAGVTEDGLLGPVEMCLLDRYGHELGQRLNREFVEAFEGSGMPLVFKGGYKHLINAQKSGYAIC